jgi:hypothetical protein
MIRSDDLVPLTEPAQPCGCMALDPPARRPLGRAASDMATEMGRLAREVDTAVSLGDVLRVMSATAAVNALVSALVERMNQLLTQNGFYGDPDDAEHAGGYL